MSYSCACESQLPEIGAHKPRFPKFYICPSYIRPLSHVPEIGAVDRNSTSDSGISFSCRCTTSNVIDCLRGPKAVTDVRSRASARKTGAGIRRLFLERVSGALAPVVVRATADCRTAVNADCVSLLPVGADDEVVERFDSTGMFHYCAPRPIEDCLIVSQLI